MTGDNLNGATDPEEIAEVPLQEADDYLSDETYQSSDEYDYDPAFAPDADSDPILSLFGTGAPQGTVGFAFGNTEEVTCPPSHAYVPTWKRVCLAQDFEVYVSSQGNLKLARNDDSTPGYSYPGSPYKIFTTGNRAYYVHDIIYRAFRGEPPAGWEVRHKTRNYTNNALSNLDIYPKLVTNPPVFGSPA